MPSLFFILVLSITRTCSHRTMLSRMISASVVVSSTCVADIDLDFDVNGHIIVVGECMLPVSFWTTTAGRTPLCSEPT